MTCFYISQQLCAGSRHVIFIVKLVQMHTTLILMQSRRVTDGSGVDVPALDIKSDQQIVKRSIASPASSLKATRQNSPDAPEDLQCPASDLQAVIAAKATEVRITPSLNALDARATSFWTAIPEPPHPPHPRWHCPKLMDVSCR